MQELFIYDRSKGLFKEILNKSLMIEGRYHVSPNMGNDLNTNNLETYISDEKNGLSDLRKYPICLCVTPRSQYTGANGLSFEEFIFNLYFLCPTFYTGENKIKVPNPDTNTSTHHIWYDWQDMKECAQQFLEVLKQVLRSRTIVIGAEEVGLRRFLALDDKRVIFNRLTKFLNDRLSGVSLSFVITMSNPVCILTDYSSDISGIVIPPETIHEFNPNE